MSTPVEQATVERVAAVMFQAFYKPAEEWRDYVEPVHLSALSKQSQRVWFDMAVAAIEALQLTEEQRIIRSICDMADPGIPERRLVGPWRTA